MRKTPALTCITLLLTLVVSGCRTAPSNGITQVATIDALLTGVYDGHLSLEKFE